jgi:hypothetical protein
MRRRAAEEFGVELGLIDGHLSLTQRRNRQWGVSIAALVVALGLFLLPGYLPQSGFAADVVRITAFTFGASLTLLAAYLPFASVEVQISRRRVERVRRCWGITLKRRNVPAEDFDDLCIDPGRSGTIGRSYDLVGRGEFGKLKLIDDIPDREFLDAIRRQIMLAAGLRPSGTH